MPSQGFGQHARQSPNHLAIAAPDGRHWSRGELWNECQRLAGQSSTSTRHNGEFKTDAATSAVSLIAQALAMETYAPPTSATSLSKMLEAYAQRIQALGVAPGDENVHFCVAPSRHGDNLTWALASLHHGHALVLAGSWQAEQMLRAVHRYRVTTAYLESGQAQDLLSLDDDALGAYDTSSLRHLIVDAAGTSREVQGQLQARLGISYAS